MTLHDDLTTALCTLHAGTHERRDGQPVVVLTEDDWRAVRDAIERVRAEVGEVWTTDTEGGHYETRNTRALRTDEPLRT